MTDKHSGAHRRIVVGMLWSICLLTYADRRAVSAVFPVLAKEYQFNNERLGLIGVAFTWVYALSAPFAGAFGDSKRRNRIVLGGLVTWGAITCLTASCSRLRQFVLVRAGRRWRRTCGSRNTRQVPTHA